MLDDHGAGDPLGLTRVTILVPTRRAVRALRDAFLRATHGRPTLLPILRAIGDVDEDALALDEGADGLAFLGEDAVPPAIADQERHFILTRLVMAWWRRDGQAVSPGRAAGVALDLARLVDSVHTNDLDFSALDDLVPEDYAAHWQRTLDFLTIVTRAWPAILAERGEIDAADRRRRLLRLLARRWRETPPADPVIAAGSTGSQPATAELLTVVAGLPQGRVILPGLDRDLDDAAWMALDDSHPQSALKRLLGRLAITRDDVAPWPVALRRRNEAGGGGRANLLRQAMYPAAISERWAEPAAVGSVGSVGGLSRIDCPDTAREALVIALMMRSVLERPCEQAALVTPDRDLARRVASELERWSISVDDSAGVALADTAPARFMRLIARATATEAAPVELMEMLKHPLASGGLAPGRFRNLARAVERICLRGPRPPAGFAEIGRLLRAAEAGDGLCRWWRGVEARMAPLVACFDRKAVSLADMLAAHVAAAEALADDGAAKANPLWAGDAGNALARAIEEAGHAASHLPPLEPQDYPLLFDHLTKGRMVRPRYGRHPRLHIWGPLEARLQHADLVILGGLNEGVWPREPAADPWLSRPMRAAFGLPPADRLIGLSAHDLTQLCGAPRAVLTRAEKADNAPTVPSRWLVRLETIVEGSGARLDDPEGHASADWLRWAQALDQPSGPPRPVKPPAPRPPVAARPRRLSVTRIEALMRDPYQIFARSILGLYPMAPLDEPPGPAHFGIMVHDGLERFFKELGDRPPGDDALDRLLAAGRSAFAALERRPLFESYWWPRFARIAEWLLAEERKAASPPVRRLIEAKGEIALPAPGGVFALEARADRIDDLGPAGALILDYKTGTVPEKSEIEAGFAPQLPLEAVILLDGGFPEVGRKTVLRLEYWKLSGGDPAGKVIRIEDVDALARAAADGLETLIARFDHAATPYLARPAPKHAPRYSDYDHLARVKEWADTAPDGE